MAEIEKKRLNDILNYKDVLKYPLRIKGGFDLEKFLMETLKMFIDKQVELNDLLQHYLDLKKGVRKTITFHLKFWKL